MSGLELVCTVPGTGYGNAASLYAAGLHRLGVPVRWVPTFDDFTVEASRQSALNLLDEPLQDDLAQLWHQDIAADTLMVDIPPGKPLEYWRRKSCRLRPFCYVAWEADRLPDTWPGWLNEFDGVMVPSRFNQKVLVEHGITRPVHVVPHIAPSTSQDNSVTFPGSETLCDDVFVFYTMGTWITRKAMENTVRAYLDAFDAHDPVVLLIKTEHWNQAEVAHRAPLSAQDPRGTTAWTLAKILAEYAQPAAIQLLAQYISPRELAAIHRRADCFVSLTHAEGWGLCGFDALLAGNPVVMTGWGGQLDYLGEDHPGLVEYELRPTSGYRDDGYFLHDDEARWAQANHDHAVALMRSVASNPDTWRRDARQRAAGVKSQFSSARVCRELAGHLGLKVLALSSGQ